MSLPTFDSFCFDHMMQRGGLSLSLVTRKSPGQTTDLSYCFKSLFKHNIQAVFPRNPYLNQDVISYYQQDDQTIGKFIDFNLKLVYFHQEFVTKR